MGYQVKLLNKAEDKLMFAEEIRINTILALLTGYGKTKVQELSELELAMYKIFIYTYIFFYLHPHVFFIYFFFFFTLVVKT